MQRLTMFARRLLTVLATLSIRALQAKHADKDVATVIFAGDVSFDGTVRYQVRKGSHTYNDSFRPIAPFVRQADLAVVNVESPFVTAKMMKQHKAVKGPLSIYLKADVAAASSLSFAGFDLVSLANNHINDYGDLPVNFTVANLKKVGIKTFGDNYGPTLAPQEPYITEVKGIKIGFLGYCLVILYVERAVDCEELRERYNAGPAPYRSEVAASDIKNLKKRVDVVVVYMHWGKEFFLEADDNELLIAKELKSFGAHVIIGSHPHVLQRHCAADHRAVAFSLGNFLFPWHVPGNLYFKNRKSKQEREYYEKSIMSCVPPTKASRLFRVWLNKQGVVKADYLPLTIEFNPKIKCLQPTPVKDAEWIEVCGPSDKACTKCP